MRPLDYWGIRIIREVKKKKKNLGRIFHTGLSPRNHELGLIKG